MINLGFHNWHDFIARAAERLTKPSVSSGTASTQERDSHTAGVSFTQALSMAQTGWQDGASQIAKALDSLPPSTSVLPDWSLDVAGAICNVPAFIAGEPECMWRLSECKRDERRIALIVQGSYNSGIPANTAMYYATAIAAVVRSLEASGINPAIYTIAHRTATGTGPSGPKAAYGYAVREFGEPLDLARVAFAFHPAWLRRIDFAWRERTPEATAAGINIGSYGSGVAYGSSVVREVLGQDTGTIAIIRGLNELDADGLLDDAGVKELVKLVLEDVAKAIAS